MSDLQVSLAASTAKKPRQTPVIKRNSISSIFAPLPSSTRQILANTQTAQTSTGETPCPLPSLNKPGAQIIIRTNRIANPGRNLAVDLPNSATLESDEEAKQLLNRLCIPMNFTYLADSIPVPQLSGNTNFSQEESDFESISKHIVRSQGNLSPEIFKLLFQMISVQLFRSLPAVPPQLLQADVPAIIAISNWKPILAIYHIISYMIVKSPRPLLAQYINQEFVKRLCLLVHSPDPNEQNVLNSLLVTIFDAFPEFHPTIYSSLLQELQKAIDGFSVSHCIKPILNFFVQYYKYLFSKTPDTPVEDFKRYYLKIFNLPFIGDSYGPLSFICTQFYQRDDTVAVCVLNFMLQHWPGLNSTKQVMYLHHITIAVPFLTPTELRILSQSIFHQIGACLGSMNFKVTLGALRMISDQQFMFLFSSQARLLAFELFKPIEVLQNHWNEDVRVQVVEASNTLNSLHIQSADSQIREDQAKLAKKNSDDNAKREEVWRMIQQRAQF